MQVAAAADQLVVSLWRIGGERLRGGQARLCWALARGDEGR